MATTLVKTKNKFVQYIDIKELASRRLVVFQTHRLLPQVRR